TTPKPPRGRVSAAIGRPSRRASTLPSGARSVTSGSKPGSGALDPLLPGVDGVEGKRTLPLHRLELADLQELVVGEDPVALLGRAEDLLHQVVGGLHAVLVQP